MNPALGKPFEEIAVGDTATLERTIAREDLEAFARLSGDWNPLHVDQDYARETTFGRPVAHGVLLASYVSTLVGMHLPGPGALWAEQRFRWLLPVFAGDRITVRLQVKHKSVGSRTLTIEVEATNGQGVTVMNGDGVVTIAERKQAAPEVAAGVALITGGSGAMGSAIARKLAAQGFAVAVGYRTHRDRAAQVCEEAIAAGGQAAPIPLDVTDAASTAAAIARVRESFFAPVTTLIHAAAPPVRAKAFEELSWNDMQEMLDLHLRGAFHGAQAALPHMLAAGSGTIVNLGSIHTEGVPPLQWTSFVAAKAALWAMTRSLAGEYGPKGIRVNMVSPGLASTDSVALVPDRLKKVQAMQSPLRQLCGPEDVAAAVAFLCSPAARMITGMELPVCAGSRM